MPIQLCDRYDIDAAAKVNVTADGYLTATPRVARTGIQLYLGSEVGVADKQVVRIYRPPEEVFNTDSMHTFAHKPMTDDHPPQPVTSKNWKQFSRGQVGDEVARDGEFIRVPMVLMDHGLVTKVQNGKAELSVGYTCDLEMTPGITADGQEYDGIQKNIRVNHIAVVDQGRAGKQARIGDGTGNTRVNFSDYAAAYAALQNGSFNTDDALKEPTGFLGVGNTYPITKDGYVHVAALRAAATDSIVKGDGDVTAAAKTLLSLVDATEPNTRTNDGARKQETRVMKTMVIDGITVEVGDGNATEVIQRHIRSLEDKVAKLTTDHTTAVTDHAKVLADKDGQITKLTTDLTVATTKVADLEGKLKDAEVTPAKLDAMVADRTAMIGKAKAVFPAVVVDGKTDSDIRRQVVSHKLGDKAKDWDDKNVAISFDTLTADVKAAATADASRPGGLQDQARALAGAQTSDAGKVKEQAWNDRNKRIADAWKGPGASA
jgi:hypothetical protein